MRVSLFIDADEVRKALETGVAGQDIAVTLGRCMDDRIGSGEFAPARRVLRARRRAAPTMPVFGAAIRVEGLTFRPG